MKIGDRIMTKKIGMPATGTIIGLMVTGEKYLSFLSRREEHFEYWTQLYPDWITEQVAIIEYDSPHKPLSKDELRDIMLEKLGYVPSDDVVDFEFNKFPDCIYSFYPVEDLEVWE